MNSDTTILTFAVAIYIGSALKDFFQAITRDLITPVLAGLFPGAQATLDKIVIQVGGIKINIGDAISATLNLMIAFLVVSMTLPYVRTYAPVGGKR
jgi:large-conductance mechanosensitive channel